MQDFLVGGWLVKPQLNTISTNATSLRLEPKAMQVLVCLAEHADNVVPKEELMRTVWGDSFVTDEVLTTAIFELRKALGDNARNPSFIQTVHKRGYRLIGSVSFDPQQTSQPQDPALSHPPAPPPVETTRRRWIVPSAVALICTILLLVAINSGDLWNRLFGRPTRSITSIAVFPLRDLSPDSGQSSFADSITEALITDLARLTPLRIVSRTSVMQYRNAERALPDIARELGVDAVVEGSVFRAGDRLRITVQLIDAASDQHLWAESYERDPQDLFALQADVARAIVEEITANLAFKQQTTIASIRSINPAAREAYFKGRQLLESRTEEGMDKAVSYFDHAVKLDSHYAEAWSGLADAYTLMVSHNHLRPEDAYPKAKTAAIRAVQLDSGIAETHASLGLVKLVYDWDRSGAARELSRAISLNPNYATARLWNGWQLWASGQLQEALLEANRARELEPGSPAPHLTAGDILYRLRRYDDAIDAYSRVLEINPSYSLAYKALGHCYHKSGRKRESEIAYLKALQLSGGVQFSEISKKFLDWSRAKDPRFLVDKMSYLLKQKYVRPTHIARLYMDLGHRDRAFDWLERAFQERDTNLLFLGSDDGWGVIRDDPRFARLLTRVGPPA